ncbi:hypothetical protein SYNPS1DRAFT_28965 [Syncephalis pseudoplumigaleata]|uniref:DM14 domain-containing protein n=1 Tax=Syncephalis pseudoplumigaleata TaxID=1712513 RepID=A0A4P9Z0B2_9FUNG|nr:hypothetical protein SYNPS1DRAFT_28965 [Syncephalis pseudoplumigaleata]|eukprot:RKP25302.1 hypothetical protein SYNPS1DRAFT_28965 [Syncephalis pseudoplumigaleata]
MFGFLRAGASAGRGQTVGAASRGRQRDEEPAAVSPEALLASLNIDLSADVTMDGQHQDVDADDDTGLDDPELLAQLAALSVTSHGATSVSATKTAQKTSTVIRPSNDIDWQDLDVISKAALAVSNDNDDDDDDEVTEEDMKNPALLAELENISQVDASRAGESIHGTATDVATLRRASVDVHIMASRSISVEEKEEESPVIDIDPMADQLDILDEIEVETQRARVSQSADEVSRSARRMQQRVDAARRINNTVIEEAAQAALAQLEAHLATLPAHAAPAKEAAAATTMIATDATIVEQELAVHLASQDVAAVEQSIQHFKVRAVQAKRAGQSTVAIAYLRASKQLAVHATSLATASLPEGEDVPDGTAASPDIETLESRLRAYKVAAVEAKRAGDLAQAREHLGIAKQLQLVLEQQTTTGMVATDFIMPPPPPPIAAAAIVAEDEDAASKTSPAPAMHPHMAKMAEQSLPAPAQSATIRARLTEQIELATTIAGTAYRRGDKETALHFHKAKKILLTDVEWIDSLQAHHQPMPLIDYRDVSYTLETSNDDLSVNELELVIHRAWDLHGAREASPGPMDVFVQWDSGLEGGKGTSPTVAKQREPGISVQLSDEANDPAQPHAAATRGAKEDGARRDVLSRIPARLRVHRAGHAKARRTPEALHH